MPEPILRLREIPLSGRLITADDGSNITPSDFQVLKNMRYGDKAPKGVKGHTKVNTTVLPETAIRNGIHFRKDQPAESHIVVDANGKCYQNTTSVPSAGDFSATAVYTDSAGASTGRYAIAPTGMLARCTGKESLLWGGTEYRCAALIDYPTTSKIYDYSEVIADTLSDTEHLATIHGSALGTADANTMLLLHLDNNVTDSSPTTAHTVTNANVTFSTSIKQFGTHSAVFNGTTGKLTIPDDADFDFSAGIFTIDFRFRPTGSGTNQPLFYQANSGDANDYVRVYLNQSGVRSGTINLEIKTASSVVVTLASSTLNFNGGALDHIAVVENGDDYYIFFNGAIVGYVADTGRAANCTGTVYIGNDGSTNWFTGYIDEYRVSNSARWTSAFSVPSAAYGPAYSSTTYIGSILPIKGFKATVGTANTQASTMSVEYWDGSGWNPVSSLSDGTASGGISLAQTGTVSFTSTATTSKLRELEKTVCHWYKVVISEAAASFTAELSNLTVDIPMQSIQDLWDGTDRPCASFLMNKGGVWSDFTPNVLKNEIDSANTYTYAVINAPTSSDYLIVGFLEPAMGMVVSIPSDKQNAVSASLSIEYWNGDAWVNMSVNDGTMDGTKTFAKSGIITWNYPGLNAEMKQTLYPSSVDAISAATAYTESTISRGGLLGAIGKAVKEKIISDLGIKTNPVSTIPLYYYRIKFSATITATTWVYYIGGISAPVDIRGYKFPLEHAGRLFLCNNVDGWNNSIKYGAYRTANIFNGSDSGDLFLGGDEAIVAGASIYNRFGSTVSNQAILCKYGEAWVLHGDTPEDWKLFRVSESIGCVAPQTMRGVNVPTKDATSPVSANAAIWVSSRGVEMFTGGSIQKISGDVDDLFDPSHSNYLTAATIATLTADYDPVLSEYHLFVPGSTVEWVLDVVRGKWFEINRNVSLYGAFNVASTTGYKYQYGFANNGYVYRLENGNTFDGTAIAHTLKTASICPYNNYIGLETWLRGFKLVQRAKNITANTVSVTHYGDTATSGTTLAAIDPTKSGRRLSDVTRMQRIGPHTFHEFQFSLSTSDETGPGFEPLMLSLYWEPARTDIRE